MLFVSHDLAVIVELCDRIVVFYAGEVVEHGPAAEILERPRHPYTQALLRVASVGDYGRRRLDAIAGTAAGSGRRCRVPLCRPVPGATDACRAAGPARGSGSWPRGALRRGPTTRP